MNKVALENLKSKFFAFGVASAFGVWLLLELLGFTTTYFRDLNEKVEHIKVVERLNDHTNEWLSKVYDKFSKLEDSYCKNNPKECESGPRVTYESNGTVLWENTGGRMVIK